MTPGYTCSPLLLTFTSLVRQPEPTPLAQIALLPQRVVPAFTDAGLVTLQFAGAKPVAKALRTATRGEVITIHLQSKKDDQNSRHSELFSFRPPERWQVETLHSGVSPRTGNSSSRSHWACTRIPQSRDYKHCGAHQWHRRNMLNTTTTTTTIEKTK